MRSTEIYDHQRCTRHGCLMAMICDDDTDFDPVISHSRESCFPHIVTARPRSGRRAAAPMPKIVDRTWAGGVHLYRPGRAGSLMQPYRGKFDLRRQPTTPTPPPLVKNLSRPVVKLLPEITCVPGRPRRTLGPDLSTEANETEKRDTRWRGTADKVKRIRNIWNTELRNVK